MYQRSADRPQPFMIMIVRVHGPREVEDLKNRANREEIEPIVQRRIKAKIIFSLKANPAEMKGRTIARYNTPTTRRFGPF